MAVNDVAPELAFTVDPPETPRELAGAQHGALTEQQQFAERHGRALTASGVSGQRTVAALHLILADHAPVPAVAGGTVHLTCNRCRPDGAPAEQYPCATARHAVFALEAVLP